VRVHDVAGKDAINESLIRIETFITFRGISDALDPDRPLLKVKSLHARLHAKRPSHVHPRKL
jgi:hypothetical protein